MPGRKRWGVLDTRNGTVWGPWSSPGIAKRYAASRNQGKKNKGKAKRFKRIRWDDTQHIPNQPRYAELAECVELRRY